MSITEDLRPPGTVPHVEHPVAPTTTTQEDLTTAGQRKINLIWERTQSVIAISVTILTLGVAAALAILYPDRQIPTIFSVAFGTVIGFYFSRTNHQQIGGVGWKPTEGPSSRR